MPELWNFSPVCGSTPCLGRSSLLGGGGAGSLRRPVRCLSTPILSDLEGTGGGSWSCSSGSRRGSTVSRPVSDTLLSTPVFLRWSSIEVPGLHHLGLGGLSPFLLLLLGLLGVAVEEQVGHDLPRRAAADGSSQSENLAGQHPPHQTDAVGALVVAWDGDVDELGGRVNVAEGDDGDVGVASLRNGLLVGPGVADHQKTGLAESGLDLIGEGSRGEPAGNGGAVDVPSELEDSSLSVGPAGTDEHISGVLNSRDGAGSQQDLLPGLLQVDDVDPVILLLEDVLLHRGLAVVRPDMDGGRQHLGDVILGNSKA